MFQMFVDLFTLYLLAVGTLFVGAAMTFWEHRTNARRGQVLRTLAAGFATLAVGCVVVLVRRQVPYGMGSAAANLVLLSGYLLVLGGIAAFSGHRYRRFSVLLLLVMALVWAIAGAGGENLVWNYVSAAPIALINGLIVWEMWRCASIKTLSARHIVIAMAGFHTVFYAARALVLPFAADVYGAALLSAVGKITLYEGVLYSVVMPMALLKLVRDESHSQLLLESQTDYLTRLGNRRSFFEQGAAAIDSRARRGPIAVLAFDLDRFKSINDVHGHHAGDEVLKRFSETARRVLGSEALLARIGGEEFAALLAGDKARDAHALGQAVARQFARQAAQDATEQAAQQLSQRLGKAIHEPVGDTVPESMPGARVGPGIAATVSVGLAYFPDAVPALPEALAAADRALYRAKAQGGDRLETA